MIAAAALLVAAVVLLTLLLGGALWPALLARLDVLLGLAARYPAPTVLLYLLAVSGLTAACLPVGPAAAAIGGALLGPLWGAAAAIGATVAGGIVLMLAARRTFGRWLARDHAALLARLQRDRFLAVLALRIAPVSPGWIVSVAAGSARIPIGTFALASAIGIAPVFGLLARVGAGIGAAIQRGEAPTIDRLLGPGELLALSGLAVLIAAPVLIRIWIRR